MTDEVYTFFSLFKSHLCDRVLAEWRPHMLFLCIRTMCLYNRDVEQIDGVAVTSRTQVLPCLAGQEYGKAKMEQNGIRIWTRTL